MKILTFVEAWPRHRHRRALNFPFSYLLILSPAFFSTAQYWATLEILAFSLRFSTSSVSLCHLSCPALNKLPTPPYSRVPVFRPPDLCFWNLTENDSGRFRIILVCATSNEIYPYLYLTSHWAFFPECRKQFRSCLGFAFLRFTTGSKDSRQLFHNQK